MIMIKASLRFCTIHEGLKTSGLSRQNNTRSEIIVKEGDIKD